MDIILNSEQQEALKVNQEVLARIYEMAQFRQYLKEFENTAIVADKLGNMATWKIYQINKPYNFAHIPANNYTKIMSQDDITEGCMCIDPLLIQEDYVVNKINEFKTILEPYPLELELFTKYKIDPKETQPLMPLIYIKDSDHNMPLTFFSTTKENIISTIEANLEFHKNDEDEIFLNTLNQVRAISQSLAEKKHLEQRVDEGNETSIHHNRLKI